MQLIGIIHQIGMGAEPLGQLTQPVGVGGIRRADGDEEIAAGGHLLDRFGLARQLFGITEGFFAPLFFVWLGASLQVRELGEHPGLIGLGAALGVGAGEPLTVTARGGATTLPLVIEDSMVDGVVWIPGNRHGAGLGELDVVAGETVEVNGGAA